MNKPRTITCGRVRDFLPTCTMPLPGVQGKERDNVLVLTLVLDRAYAIEADFAPVKGQRVKVTIEAEQDETEHQPANEGRAT